jgi:hypothetical protein
LLSDESDNSDAPSANGGLAEHRLDGFLDDRLHGSAGACWVAGLHSLGHPAVERDCGASGVAGMSA